MARDRARGVARARHFGEREKAFKEGKRNEGTWLGEVAGEG